MLPIFLAELQREVKLPWGGMEKGVVPRVRSETLSRNRDPPGWQFHGTS